MLDKNSVVLVTGGTGFLGKAVVGGLLTKGYRRTFTFGSRQHDLTEKSATEKLFQAVQPDAVIHLAAKVGGIGANKVNPGLFAYSNLAMGMNIVEACRKFPVKKLIIAGTVCMYPKYTPVPFKEEDLWNGYPEETNAPYGLAKKMIFELAKGYRQQYGLNAVNLLPVNLYGPWDNFDLESSHVIPAMIRKFHEAKENGSTVTLWGDGSPTREFLYVDDAAEAFVAALERYEDPDSEPVNLGSGKEISMKDLAQCVADVVGYRTDIVWDSTKPNGQPRRCLDTSKATERFGWTAKTDFQTGLKTTYDWYLSELKRGKK